MSGPRKFGDKMEKSGMIEIKARRSGERWEISADNVTQFFKGIKEHGEKRNS